jgi:zinc protease
MGASRQRSTRANGKGPGRSSPSDPPPGVRLVTFANGLTLIIREDHSAPVVSAQAWCRAGSIDEGRWLGAGLSHVLEHMLFKGTTTRAAGRIDQEVQEAGGYMNAYTSFDRTVYWINVPNTGARVAIDILCDIIQHATLPDEELAKEMDVIRREMDMTHDDPHQRSARRLFETAYTRSPYRFTIIGYPDIFNDVRRPDVESYYREKYAPNNVFFVVVGDVDAGAVEAQIQAAFSDSKTRPMPPSVLPSEPRQVAAREVLEEGPIEMAHLHFSWHIPELRHPDIPGLDVLATLLGGGRSSRLYQKIREKQGLVNSVDAWTYSPGNPGLFGMSAVMDAEKYEAARDAMLRELARLKTTPVTRAEVNKAVKQFVSGNLASRKTMQGQAQDLGGNWLSAGDLNFSERYLEAVRQLTPEILQRLARQYLVDENRTLYALLPKGTMPARATRVEVHSESALQKAELPNGLRLLIKEDHRLPFVELRLVLEGGVLAETPENNGITLLLSRLLLQGTKRRSAEQIASGIESVGGHIDTYGGNNSLGASVEVMRSDFDTGLDLLADVLLHPSFPAPGFERERQVQLAAIRAQRDELLASAGRLMRREMFGQQAYGLLTQGTEDSVSRLHLSQLRAFHTACVVPNKAVLAIFGDIDAKTARAAVTKKFGQWKMGGGARVLTPAPVRASAQARRVTESRDKKQAVIVVGFPGGTLSHPDHYALELLQEACSDLGSRLFLAIRERLGLAYYVGAQNFSGLVPGYFAFYVGTDPAKAGLVEEELFRQAAELRDEGLTEAELKRAKAKVIGQKKIARQDLGACAAAVALDELYGLGYQHSDKEDALYEAVTLDDIKRVARQYLQPEASVVAVVSPGTP